MSVDDKFKPVQAADVTDLALLPRRFDQFAAEVRTSFELLTERLMPTLTRIEETLADVLVRVTRLEHDRDNVRKRLVALEQQLEKKTKRIARRK